MYNAVMLTIALVGWLVFIFPPIMCSTKKGALLTRFLLAMVVSFCLSAGMTRAWLGLF